VIDAAKYGIESPFIMLLFEDAGVLFIHIPKTGGTSLREFVGGRANRRSRRWTSKLMRRLPGAVERWPWVNLDNRPHMSVMRMEACGFPSRIWKEFELFTVVRHPLEWQFSMYRHHCRRHREGQYGGEVPGRHLESFEDYLRFRIDCGALPQVTMLVDSAGRVQCDGFARLERLADELPPLLARASIPWDEYPRENVDPSRERPRWSPAVLDSCHEAYRDDYELFGYTREGGTTDRLPIRERIVSSPLRERIELLDRRSFDPWRIHDFRTSDPGPAPAVDS